MDIYLAGAEGGAGADDRFDQGTALHEIGYPFRLASYHYIKESARAAEHAVFRYQNDPGSKWIMDSGLFTLMYGQDKHRERLRTVDDLRRYCFTYIEDLVSWGWKHPIVECDAQDKFGLDVVERIRDDVFRQCPFEVIYVWHVPDREVGLASIVAREAWVSCSLPEFRKVYGPAATLRKAVIAFLDRCRRPGAAVKRIHLLGNSASDLVRMPAHTCDSTSWLTPARFGNGYVFENGAAKPVSIYSPKWARWLEWCRAHHSEAFSTMAKLCQGERRIVYWSNALASAVAFWMLMESVNG